jgi:hypothetical protein
MDGRRIIWTHFILAAALVRTANAVMGRAGEAEVLFSYADTHAGPGRLDAPAQLGAVAAARDEFTNTAYHQALEGGRPYPGSWVLAARVLDRPELFFECDANDIDEAVITAAKANRESGWTRLWSHDWFLFLRNRLAMASRPHFVLIDPPPNDPRGPGYAIDAAILLDTMGLPYMVSYPVGDPKDPPQDAIDQIGRTGLELHVGDWGYGVLLGGGAESVVLDALPDLRRLAGLLGGTLATRLPRAPTDDYCI